MKEIFTFNTDDVYEVRDAHGIGLAEAKRILERRDIENAIDAAETVADLKEILKWIINQ